MNKWNTKLKRNCLICNNLYLPQSNSQKFCNKCRIKKCIVCKKDYYAGNKFVSIKDSKFCSRKCYLKNRWKKSDKCLNCGKQCSLRFCSYFCQKSYWNKNGYQLNAKKKIWEKKIALIKELGGKCVKCGIDDIQVLEINHIDRKKKERPKKLQYTWQRRFKEWNKNKNNLELLCANCHRKLTWIQMGWGNY